MSSPSDGRPKLARDDADFVSRVAASYAPPPMPAARRAAFDEALLARLRRRRVQSRWVGMAWLPAAAAAGLVAVWLFAGWPAGDGPVPSGEIAPAFSARAWEDEVLLEGGFLEAVQTDESELLPEEYVAIAGVLLDG